MPNKTLIIAGCTRSGLTLTMQILNKGGYPCLGTYPAFEDYEYGSIDFEKSKGKAVKLVDTHNQIPPDGEYYVIRLRRDLHQQAKSFMKFLCFMGIRVDESRLEDLKQSIIEDYKIIDEWALKQRGLIYVDFETLLDSPNSFLVMLKESFGIELSSNAIDCVIDREPECYDTMLELQFLTLGQE